MKSLVRHQALALAAIFSLLGFGLHAQTVPSTDGEMLVNGNFAQGQTHWTLLKNGSANADFTILAEPPGNQPVASISVSADNSPGALWYVSLKQDGLAVVKGKSYRLSFRMKASKIQMAYVNVKQDNAPWGNIAGIDGKPLELTDQWQEFEYDFTPQAGEPAARLSFTNLYQPGMTWYLTGVSLKEVPAK